MTSIIDCLPTKSEDLDPTDCESDVSSVKKSRKKTTQHPKRKANNEHGSRSVKKRVVISDMLTAPTLPSSSSPHPKTRNDTIINMGLNRAQTLKNFIDRIRGNQSQYLPCTFTPNGMIIQCMEPGHKTWVHAELWQEGCDFYGYAHTHDSLQITLQFKDFHQLVKGADANDKIYIRVFKAEPTVVQLVLINGKAETTFAINSVENAKEEEVVSLRSEISKRINDEHDMEFRVPTSELQRKITLLTSAKLAAVEFKNEGNDLIMREAKVSKLCAIKKVSIKFFNTRVRPLNTSMDVSSNVMLRFLIGVCKGPSNTVTNQTNGSISLRLGNEKDVLVTETFGSMGKLILGIRTGCD